MLFLCKKTVVKDTPLRQNDNDRHHPSCNAKKAEPERSVNKSAESCAAIPDPNAVIAPNELIPNGSRFTRPHTSLGNPSRECYAAQLHMECIGVHSL